MKNLNITIVGPQGSGKTLLAKIIARSLHDEGVLGALIDGEERVPFNQVNPSTDAPLLGTILGSVTIVTGQTN